eukprot:6192855-Pleurochrysis_carterae.AAC.4
MPACEVRGSSKERQRTLPAKATVCRGRRPSSSGMSVDAPFCSNRSTTSCLCCVHAQWRGVRPALSVQSTADASRASIRRKSSASVVLSPFAAAMSAAVRPSESRSSTLVGAVCSCRETAPRSPAVTARCSALA